MKVVKFDIIEVKWDFPRVKYPHASNPLNVFKFSMSFHFSSYGIADEREMASLSLHKVEIKELGGSLLALI